MFYPTQLFYIQLTSSFLTLYLLRSAKVGDFAVSFILRRSKRAQIYHIVLHLIKKGCEKTWREVCSLGWC